MIDISVECTSEYAEDLVISLRTESMAVKREEQDMQSFNVKVVRTGEVKEGYYCYQAKAATALVQVTGSLTQMQSVKEVVAIIDVTDRSETFTADCELIAYDFQGNQIDPQKVSYSEDTVQVTAGICPTKPIDIKVVTEGEPQSGYYVEKIEFAPQSFLIASEESILKNIRELEIPYSVEGASGNIEVELNVADFLNERYDGTCFVADSNSSISVVITISPMVEKVLEMNEHSITPMNVAEGLECVVYSAGKTVVVKGPAAEIEKLTVDDLRLYVDLTGCVSGTYSRQVKSGAANAPEFDADDVMVRLSEIGADAPQE